SAARGPSKAMDVHQLNTIQATAPAGKGAELSRVHLVGAPQPAHHLVVDLGDARERNAVTDAVLLLVAAGREEAPGRRGVLEREAEVETGPRRRLELGEHVGPVERHERLARARPDVASEPQPGVQELLVDRPQPGLAAREHRFDVAQGGREVRIWIVVLAPLAA